MAKIENGALTASISGKLGPVVFYQTKFGTVAASKGLRRVHTTAPALETKRTFATAARCVGAISPSTIQIFAAVFEPEGLSGHGPILGNIMRLLRNQELKPWPTRGRFPNIAPGTPFHDGTRWRIPFTVPSLTGVPGFWLGWCLDAQGTMLGLNIGFTFADRIQFQGSQPAVCRLVWLGPFYATTVLPDTSGFRVGPVLGGNHDAL